MCLRANVLHLERDGFFRNRGVVCMQDTWCNLAVCDALSIFDIVYVHRCIVTWIHACIDMRGTHGDGLDVRLG